MQKKAMAQEVEATIKAEYSLQKLIQDRASLVNQLEQLKKMSYSDEEELETITEELRNAQIADLQQKILESDQETRANSRGNIIADTKAAFETAFYIVAQNRNQQCYKYDELKEKYQNLETQLQEYEKQQNELKEKYQNLETQLQEYEKQQNELKENLEARLEEFEKRLEINESPQNTSDTSSSDDETLTRQV